MLEAVCFLLGLLLGAFGSFFLWQGMGRRFVDSFRAVSAEALQNNNQSFLDLAKTQLESVHNLSKAELQKREDHIREIVLPVKESLERVDQKIQEIERSRARSEEGLIQNVRMLLDTQKELRSETNQIVAALRAPQARGRWGEMQLKRVVEMAGMLEHCDFFKQESATTEDGRLRPDMIVKLPGGKNVVVDAKTPLHAYLDAVELTDPESKRLRFLEHSKHVRRHIEQLSRKSYWDQFRPAPEFVVLFLPGESFFSAALESDPSLIEAGVQQNVILATPTTLIALLRAVAFGWRQEKLAANARMIGDLGKELYKRLYDMSSHFERLRKSLDDSVESYNRMVGTMESRVLVSARRFRDLQADVGAEISPQERIDRRTRSLESPELGSREP